MLNNISGNELNINSSIKQQELQGVERKKTATNPYSKPVEFVDQQEISNQALELYEKDKDIQKFTKMVLEDLNETETQDNIILDLVNSGNYDISDEDLANSLLDDEDFIDIFS